MTHTDTILFGSVSCTLADEFGERIDAALAEGVSSLPLLPQNKDHPHEESGEERFLRTLRHVYFRNVDVMESYTARNIFSLQNLPPTKRTNVIKVFLEEASLEHLTRTTHTAGSAESTEAYQYPALKDIPSSETLSALQNELRELRSELRAARTRRAERLWKLQALVRVHQHVQGAALQLQANTANHPDAIHNSITAMVVGKQGLEQLQEESNELSQNLDTEKQHYSAQDDENVENHKKRPKLSFEERFQQDQKTIKTSRTGIDNMKELLESKQ